MQRFPTYPCPPHRASPLPTSPPDGTFVTTDEPTWTRHHHPESTVYPTAHSWCCTVFELDKCIMIYSHHYGINILKSIFIVLKIFCALRIHLSLLQPLATASFFPVSIVLPFPECHRVGTMQDVAFSDWLLSLNNMQLEFLHVFSWLDGSFLFNTE